MGLNSRKRAVDPDKRIADLKVMEGRRAALFKCGLAPVTVWVPDTGDARARVQRFVDGLSDNHRKDHKPRSRLMTRVGQMMGWNPRPKISRARMAEFLLSQHGIAALHSYIFDTDYEDAADPEAWVRIERSLRSGNEEFILRAALELWDMES
jgi:hypothetical protein